MRDEGSRLGHPSSLILHPSSFISHPSSLTLHLSSFISHPSSVPQPALFNSRKRSHLMRSCRPLADDVANQPAAHDERVGNEPAVAAPGQNLGAHQGGATLGGRGH